MSKLIQSEIAKCMGNLLQHHTAGSSNSKNDANLVHEQPQKQHPFDGHFAFTPMPSMEIKECIIDSGVSSHICCTPDLLHTTYKLDTPTVINLPDGSSRAVAYVGNARINKDMILTDVLYVP